MAYGVDRGVRKGQLVTYVQNNPGVSTRKLAQLMKMSYSTHFRQLVQEAYNEGLIWHCEGRMIAKNKANRWYPPQWSNNVTQS